jgi:hypothetical protein
MSSKEKWKQFLSEQKVFFEETDTGLMITSRPPRNEFVNDGYSCFYVDVVFDKDGTLTTFGIWE